MFDGNFSAEQLKMKHPEHDIRLSDGDGFMVGSAKYKRHLTVAKELKEVSILCVLFDCQLTCTAETDLPPI